MENFKQKIEQKFIEDVNEMISCVYESIDQGYRLYLDISSNNLKNTFIKVPINHYNL